MDELQLAETMVRALLKAQPELAEKSYGAVLGVAHRALEAYAHEHAWSTYLRHVCERSLFVCEHVA